MENLINKMVEDFKVQAYHKGSFVEVTRENILGHWSVLFLLSC